MIFTDEQTIDVASFPQRTIAMVCQESCDI